jgi:outer membrane protein OmpA-like peptidoglycan-associated protein
VEGEYWRINYYPQATATSKPSDLQILRNYENAIKQQGGTVLAAEKGRETFRLAKNGKEVWIQVSAEFTGKYGLIIVEKQAMAQDVVANADAMKAGLAESGHVEVPGIFFDFGKAEVKPESEGALKEVAKLLQASPGLKVWVVGHTDYVGSAETNLTLSAARAASVVRYLTGILGVDPKRLGSFGAGPYAPFGANNTEEGRAKNRRVELVAQP